MKLYVIISNGGDGSCYPHYTLDEKLIDHLQVLHDDDILDYESGFADGDGFHYDTITVPDGSTAESLNIHLMDSEYWFKEYPLEEGEE